MQKETKNIFLKINKRRKQAKTSELHSSSAESVLMGWKQDPMCQTRIDRLLLIRRELEQWWIWRSIHNKRVSAHHQNCGCPCGWDYQPVSGLAWREWCATHAAVGQGPEMTAQKVVRHSSQTARHSEHVWVFPVSWFNTLNIRFLLLLSSISTASLLKGTGDLSWHMSIQLIISTNHREMKSLILEKCPNAVLV